LKEQIIMKKYTPVFGLIDCNNFFVSCERLNAPQFAKAPVIVLSNNDGCVISRSNEVKTYIKMGTPFFKLKDIVEKYNVQVFSCNHTLYSNISNRIMNLLKDLVPGLEVYSIDEAFLDFSGFPDEELTTFGRKVVQRVTEDIGIPVSLGIGPTKTLAKVANHIVKNEGCYDGVFNLSATKRAAILPSVAIEDIWGIGRRWTSQLKALGIENAYQLSQQAPVFFQRKFNKILAAIIVELNGTSVFPLEPERKPNKQIIVSRSFGRIVTEQMELKQAVTSYTTQALEKLRKQGSVAKRISVFLQTNRFTATQEPYHHEIDLELPVASDDTREFLKIALIGVEKLYSIGKKYKKSGVVITNISQKNAIQMDLFSPRDEQSEKRMAVLDKINAKMGQGVIRYAAEGFDKSWQARSSYRPSLIDLPFDAP